MSLRTARKSRLFVLAVVGLASAALHFTSTPSRAEPDAAAAPDPDAARRARVVLTVGARKVTVGELEDRIAAIPLYQLSQFGGSREAVARAYVDQILVRDLVLAAGAEQRHLDQQLPTKQLVDRALSGFTLRKNRIAYASAAAIPMEDVR